MWSQLNLPWERKMKPAAAGFTPLRISLVGFGGLVGGVQGGRGGGGGQLRLADGRGHRGECEESEHAPWPTMPKWDML